MRKTMGYFTMCMQQHSRIHTKIHTYTHRRLAMNISSIILLIPYMSKFSLFNLRCFLVYNGSFHLDSDKQR